MVLPTDPLSKIISAFQEGIGAWLVGTFLSTLLEGMLLQHTYRYFRLYPNDPYYLKLWVVLTVIMQTVGVVLTMQTSYYYTVTNYFNPTVIIRSGNIYRSAATVPVFGAITTLLSESFFARRVFKIGPPNYRIIVASAMAMILAAVGIFLAVAAQAFQVHNLVEFVDQGSWLPTAGTALLLGGDLQLTTVLVYVLRRNRRGVKRTDSMIDVLVVYTIGSGLLICIFNVLSLILTIVSDNMIYTAAFLVSQQVYTNSFVIALNTRRFVMRQGDIGASDVPAPAVHNVGHRSGPSANEVELVSMAFASGPSQSLILDASAKGQLNEAKDTVTKVDLGQDSDRTSSDPCTAV